METLAFITIGVIAGILFASSAVATSVLAYLSWRTNKQYAEVVTQMKDTSLITRQLVHRIDSTRFEQNVKVMSAAADKLKFVAEYFHSLYTTARPGVEARQPDAQAGAIELDQEEYAAEGESAFGFAPSGDEVSNI